MPKFWQLLSETGKVRWPQLYQELTGSQSQEPARDQHSVHVQGKLESLEEIDKLMRQRPRGRMGRGSA